MRLLLTRYFVSLVCFVLVGTLVLQLYLAGYRNWHDAFTTDAPVSLPMLVVFVVLGFLSYLPLLLFYAGVPMALAALLYVFFCAMLGARVDRLSPALLAGGMAGLIAAIVARFPEFRLTPEVWWWSYALGCVIAGSLSAAVVAWLLRNQPAFAAGRDSKMNGLRSPESRRSVAATLVASAVALLAAGTALNKSLATEDDVWLRREAEAAAQRFRAAPVDQQTALIADLMVTPGHKASISERLQPNAGPTPRPIRDREQLAAELAAIHTRLGPALSTRHLGSMEGSAATGRFSALFIDHHSQLQADETLYYRLQGRDVVLTMYNLIVQGRGPDQAYTAVLISR
jgi:hypothetical protein